MRAPTGLAKVPCPQPLTLMTTLCVPLHQPLTWRSSTAIGVVRSMMLWQTWTDLSSAAIVVAAVAEAAGAEGGAAAGRTCTPPAPLQRAGWGAGAARALVGRMKMRALRMGGRMCCRGRALARAALPGTAWRLAGKPWGWLQASSAQRSPRPPQPPCLLYRHPLHPLSTSTSLAPSMDARQPPRR